MTDLKHQPHGGGEGNTLVAGQGEHLMGRGGGGGERQDSSWLDSCSVAYYKCTTVSITNRNAIRFTRGEFP